MPPKQEVACSNHAGRAIFQPSTHSCTVSGACTLPPRFPSCASNCPAKEHRCHNPTHHSFLNRHSLRSYSPKPSIDSARYSQGRLAIAPWISSSYPPSIGLSFAPYQRKPGGFAWTTPSSSRSWSHVARPRIAIPPRRRLPNHINPLPNSPFLDPSPPRSSTLLPLLT